MVEIRWTFQSVEDLESITNYISKDSSYFAKLIISNIIDVVDQLVFYPEFGRVVPEINKPEIREIIFGNYRIIYRYQNSLVEIVTIYHSSRMFNSESIT
jgi:toxin ParE1/3/4